MMSIWQSGERHRKTGTGGMTVGHRSGSAVFRPSLSASSGVISSARALDVNDGKYGEKGCATGP